MVTLNEFGQLLVVRVVSERHGSRSKDMIMICIFVIFCLL